METVRNTYNSQNPEKSKVINLEKGKLPPQAVELEEAILGALLIDKAAAEDLFEFFDNPEFFYRENHKLIFEAIKSLYEGGSPIDLLTVSQQLKKTGKLEQAGGDFAIIQLTQKISSSAHIEYHARIVMQKYVDREIIKLSSTAIEMAYDESGDVFDLMDFFEMRFTAVTEMISRGKKTLTWEGMLNQAVKNVEMLSAAGGDILGVPTGFSKLDKFFGGWRHTNLYVLGARPGAGKTAFTIKAMLGAAEKGSAVGYLSLEMSGEQMATRAISVNSHFHLSQLTNKGLTEPKYFTTLIEVTNKMKSLPIHIDDESVLTVADLKRKARQMRRKYNIEVLFLDYLQLAAGGNKDVRYKINDMVYVLKALAKELNIAVVVLSQLNREVDKRQVPRPKMSDLKESSAIEDAGDAVFFLYRPAYYGLEVDYDKINPGENTEFIVEKNRHGGVGTLGLWFEANKTKFTDTEHGEDNASIADNKPTENPNWEQEALKRSLPSPDEAFGGPDNKSSNQGDSPF